MASQIVMDQTGDTRHEFDPENAEALARAEQRFRELTGISGFARRRERACTRSANFTGASLARTRPTLAAAGCCPNGCRSTSAHNSSSTGILTSSAATPARDTAFTTALPPTSPKSTMPGWQRWGGASSRQASSCQATSCWRRRSRSRRTRRGRWRSPTGFRRQRTRSIFTGGRFSCEGRRAGRIRGAWSGTRPARAPRRHRCCKARERLRSVRSLLVLPQRLGDEMLAAGIIPDQIKKELHGGRPCLILTTA